MAVISERVRDAGAFSQRLERWLRVARRERPGVAAWMGALLLRQTDWLATWNQQNPGAWTRLVNEALRAVGADPFEVFQRAGVDPHRQHQ
jgi:hypothetical protein